MELDWRDRRTGNPVRILALGAQADPDAIVTLASGAALAVETMARVLGRYIRRPEHKSLSPNGDPAGPATVGLLERRPVCGHPDSTKLIGKEGNQLVERGTGQVEGVVEYRNDYGMRSDPWQRTLERLREIGATEIVRRTGFSRSAVYAVLAGARPRPEQMRLYETVAKARRSLIKTPVPRRT